MSPKQETLLAEDASLSASPQHLCGLVTWGKFRIALSIRSCPLMVKGPCMFVVGCLDAWMTHLFRHHMLHEVCPAVTEVLCKFIRLAFVLTAFDLHSLFPDGLALFKSCFSLLYYSKRTRGNVF